MNNKINIIQFMPYFPPHKGGVETVGEEIGKYWVKKDFGEFINVVSEFEQEKETSPQPSTLKGHQGPLEERGQEQIIFMGEIIGYKKDGYEVLVCPSFEIINNFPIYKIWDKKYGIIIQYLKEKTSAQPSPLEEREQEQNWRVITHTRFFLTSFIGGLFAIKNKIKWIHIEHGSSYVKLSSKLKSFLSIIYDKSFGKWIFKKVNKILAISEACKSFINRKFVDREVDVFYRGIEFPENIKIYEDLKEKFKGKTIIGYVGRLYKWKNVESLIKAYYLLEKNNIQLVIVGDGEDFERLKLLDSKNKVYFTGGKSFEEALSYQKQFDIHIHPSSPGGGLATTLLQAMSFGCMIVATPNEGAKEVIENNKNGFLSKDDSVYEIKRSIEIGINNLGLKDKFSVENRKIIDEKFKWDNNILKLYNLIK